VSPPSPKGRAERRTKNRGMKMRKIVLKRNNTNILLNAIMFGVIFGIVAYPIGSYLLNIGLRPLYSYLVAIGWNLTAWTLAILMVKIEPKGR
jgi:hypothetical protein